MRHQPVPAPGAEILAYLPAYWQLGEHGAQFVSQAPVGGLLGLFSNLLQRQLQQAVLGSVRQKDVMPNLEVMLSSRRLAHLCHNVQLTTQKALLFFDTPIVEAHTPLYQ
ncbi:hypothetical protein D9M71_773690 [compost metagenome]